MPVKEKRERERETYLLSRDMLCEKVAARHEIFSYVDGVASLAQIDVNLVRDFHLFLLHRTQGLH